MIGYFLIAGGGALVLVLGALFAAYLFSRQVAAKVREALPPKGELIEVEGGRLHYIDKGEGQPIVLIHGLSGNLHNFNYALVDRLAEDFRVIAVDRPGCGYSTRDSDERARLPLQAAMIAELIEKLGLEKPLISGHSLGGAVSLFMALNHSDQVGALAMISPLTAVQEKAPDVFKGIDIPNPAMRRLVANTIAIPVSLRTAGAVVETVFAPEPAPEDFRTRGGGLLTLRPEAFYASATDLQAVAIDMLSVQSRYAEIRVPIGMLYGDEDAVLNADHHIDALRKHQPELDLVRIPAVGHMPIVTQADASIAFIRRMAEKNS